MTYKTSNSVNGNPKAGSTHDKGYKKLLKNKKVLLHMLRKYTDFSWAYEIREENIEFVDKEFVNDKFRTYESDLICKISKGEETIYLFLLMELQSKMDFTIPFRLLVYMVDVWEDYFRNVPKEIRERKNFRLPVVVPVVLYNGRNNWTAKRDFAHYLKDGTLFGKYAVSFRYALIDIHRLSKDRILNSNTLIDNVFYLDSAKDSGDFLTAVKEVMDRVQQLPQDEKNQMEVWFQHLLEGRFGKKEQEFIQECFRKGEKKMISTFEQIWNADVKRAQKRGRKQGLRQGREQGLRQGMEQGLMQGMEQGLRQGKEQGLRQGMEQGLRNFVEYSQEVGQSRTKTEEAVSSKFKISREEAHKRVEKYWKE